MTDPETIVYSPPDPDAIPRDDALPSLPLLLGADAREVLMAAVAEGGGVVESARPRFVLYRPGRRVAVRYWARVRWPKGEPKNTTLVATERIGGPPDGAVPVERDGATIGVWRWPYDPRLPGLRAATSPDYVRKLLDAYGAPPGRIYLRTMSYWPGRRAVIEVTIPSRGLRFDAARGRVGKVPEMLVMFIKVVRPGEAQPLYERHAALGSALPIASCPGGSDEHGLLVLQALPGATLREVLPRGAAHAPDPSELVKLVRRLGDFDLPGEPRSTTAERVADHLRLLRAVLPSEADALDRLADAYGEERVQPMTTVHGDFHDSQVLVERGAVSGLLDVDDAGPGQRVDDLALMLGRVWTLAHFANGDRAPVRRYADRLLESFGAEVDDAELRRRVAGAIVGRATMPFRAQDPGWPELTRAHLRLAADWLSQQAGAGVPL